MKFYAFWRTQWILGSGRLSSSLVLLRLWITFDLSNRRGRTVEGEKVGAETCQRHECFWDGRLFTSTKLFPLVPCAPNQTIDELQGALPLPGAPLILRAAGELGGRDIKYWIQNGGAPGTIWIRVSMCFIFNVVGRAVRLLWIEFRFGLSPELYLRRGFSGLQQSGADSYTFGPSSLDCFPVSKKKKKR